MGQKSRVSVMSFGYVSQDICAIRVLGYFSMIVEWRAGSACAWFQRPAVKTKNCVCGSTIVLLWLDCANGNYTSTLCGCNGAVSLSNISFLFFQVSNFIRRLLLLTLCVCARCFFFLFRLRPIFIHDYDINFGSHCLTKSAFDVHWTRACS